MQESLSLSLYIYIYIYIEREREGGRERERDNERGRVRERNKDRDENITLLKFLDDKNIRRVLSSPCYFVLSEEHIFCLSTLKQI